MTFAPFGPANFALAQEFAYGFLAGGGLGLLHFGSLQWNVRCFVEGHAAWALLLQIARLAFLALALAMLAHAGALPLIAAGLGLLIARSSVLRHDWRRA